MKIIIKIFIAVLVIISCTDKFDAPDNSVDPGFIVVNDTVYIQQNPVWKGFNKPQDIIVGNEPFLYIADTDNDRIVMMDVSGEFLGATGIKRPVAITQDYELNLIVCAQFDTVISGVNSTYSAVYKIDLFAASHQIEYAPVTRLLPKTSFDFLRQNREYTGVCVFSDNSFYVARRGPSNNNPIDPDNVILSFKKKRRRDHSVVDTLVGRVPLLEPAGTGLLSANQLSSLTAFRGNNVDILITLVGENSFKAQWLHFISNEDFTGYQNYLDPYFSQLMEINKFIQPEDAAFDDRNNIFIADAAKDSIYKFNSFGDEMESFGGSDVFNSPHAVAYFDRTLYVADTNNDRILRFILSTEID